MMDRKTMVSRLMLITSMLIFGSVGIFRRLIPLPSSVLACWRGISGAVFLLLFMRIAGIRVKQKITPRVLALLILSGAGIGINWVLLFEAYNYTTVSAATLCYYMQPVIVIMLSPLVFRERLTVRKLMCVLAATAGMVLVSGLLGEGAGSVKGALLGIAAACFYASVVMTNKKLPGIDVYIKTAVQLASAAAVTMPYILLTEDVTSLSIDSGSIVLLVIIGLVHTGVAYALYFGSMDALNVQSVAIISYLDPIAAMILSAIVLGEAITLYEIIGAVLILGAAAVSELRKE